MSLQDGRVAADPFFPTADLVELLRARAERLEVARRPAPPTARPEAAAGRVRSTTASVPSSSRGAAGSLTGGAAVWANLASVYLIWGSTYLAIRVLVRTVPPLYGAGARFVVAGALMLAFLGRRSLRVNRRELLACAVIGTLLAAGGNGLVTVAEQDVPSGHRRGADRVGAAVDRRLPRGRRRPHHGAPTLFGVLAGFAGVAILLLPGSSPARRSGPSLVIVAAAVSWGFGSFISPSIGLPRDGLVTTGWQMLFGGLVLHARARRRASTSARRRASRSGRGSTWCSSASLVAYTSYTWLLRNAPIQLVSTYAYVNPVVAVILGARDPQRGGQRRHRDRHRGDRRRRSR